MRIIPIKRLPLAKALWMVIVFTMYRIQSFIEYMVVLFLSSICSTEEKVEPKRKVHIISTFSFWKGEAREVSIFDPELNHVWHVWYPSLHPSIHVVVSNSVQLITELCMSHQRPLNDEPASTEQPRQLLPGTQSAKLYHLMNGFQTYTLVGHLSDSTSHNIRNSCNIRNVYYVRNVRKVHYVRNSCIMSITSVMSAMSVTSVTPVPPHSLWIRQYCSTYSLSSNKKL